jgi:hypothetical protein
MKQPALRLLMVKIGYVKTHFHAIANYLKDLMVTTHTQMQYYNTPFYLVNNRDLKYKFIFRAKLFKYKYPTFPAPVILHTYPSMKMEQTECLETLACKLQTPVDHPE